jgi:hypothetical protein
MNKHHSIPSSVDSPLKNVRLLDVQEIYNKPDALIVVQQPLHEIQVPLIEHIKSNQTMGSVVLFYHVHI